VPVVNLQPGNIMNVNANQIQGNAHVYRTGQGYPNFGSVAWQPNGGPAQIRLSSRFCGWIQDGYEQGRDECPSNRA
jgi:hypothetical protein